MTNMKTLFLRKSDLDKNDITLSKYRLPYEDHVRCPRCLIIPDEVKIENYITFNLSIYNAGHRNNRNDKHVVIELMAIINASDMFGGGYSTDKNTIYDASPITSMTVPFLRFISPKISDEFTIVTFNSDLINHPMNIYNDNSDTYLTVDDRSYEIINVIFDELRICDVELLRELKSLNVLQFRH